MIYCCTRVGLITIRTNAAASEDLNVIVNWCLKERTLDLVRSRIGIKISVKDCAAHPDKKRNYH